MAMFIHGRSCGALVFLLLGVPVVASAQQEAIDELKARVDELEQKLADQADSGSKILVDAPKTPGSPGVTSDLVIFGNFRGSLNAIDDAPEPSNTQDGLSFRNNASVLGLRGELSSARYTAFFKYLMRAHNDAVFSEGAIQSLYYYAGLKTPAGSFQAGTQTHPYKAPALEIDPYYDTSAAIRGPLSGNGGLDGSNIGMSLLSMGFTRNVLSYKSPKFSGFDVDLAVIVDDTNEDNHDYNLGFTYTDNKFRVGLQHLVLDESTAVAFSDGEGNATRLWGELSVAKWTAAVSFEEVNVELEEDQTHVFLSSKYSLTPKLLLAVTWGDSDTPDPTDEYRDGSGYTLGTFYKVLPNFRVWGLYHDLNRASQTLEDRTVLSLGMEYSFAWKQALR